MSVQPGKRRDRLPAFSPDRAAAVGAAATRPFPWGNASRRLRTNESPRTGRPLADTRRNHIEAEPSPPRPVAIASSIPDHRLSGLIVGIVKSVPFQ
ncbi:MAG: hypothetical protein ABI868_26085, partial [Acidobacteriota bacterium]